MKRAFTMIELIFVIVILGILAAIAIPKMMATRTDATISKIRQDVQTMESEIQGYIEAKGTIPSGNLSLISPTIAKYESEGKIVNTPDQNESNLFNCIQFKIVSGPGHDINLTVKKLDTNSDVICKSVQKAVFGNTNELNFSLRGESVNY